MQNNLKSISSHPEFYIYLHISFQGYAKSYSVLLNLYADTCEEENEFYKGTFHLIQINHFKSTLFRILNGHVLTAADLTGNTFIMTNSNNIAELFLYRAELLLLSLFYFAHFTYSRTLGHNN